MKYYLLLTVVFLSYFAAGCSGSGTSDVSKIDDPNKAFAVAMKNYDNKDYVDATDDFSLIKVKFSGTSIRDEV